jgi:hypothetical protein
MKQVFSFFILLLLLLLLGAMAFVPAVPTQAQAGVAWTALFFPSNNFSGTSVIASYPNGLSQNWGTGAPRDGAGAIIPGMPTDNFSARFTANTTLVTGFYEFTILADDGIRLYANGQLLIDDFGATGQKQRSIITQVTVGGSFQIVVEYVDYTGGALIQVNWVVSNGTPQPTATPAPIAIVNVEGVRGLAVRTGPFLGASMVAVARPGTDYNVLARNTQEGLFTWYYIQYDADTQGWVSGRYLAFTFGSPDVVPLRNSTQFDQVIDPPGFVMGTTRSVMNFRVFPTERAPRVAAMPQLAWGANVEILARTVQGGQNFWFQVRYNDAATNTSFVGWIYAPFVAISGDPIDSVPIR